MELVLADEGPATNWERLIEKVAFLKNELEGQISSFGDIDEYVQTQRRLYLATPYGWPAPGYLSSHFGRRTDPFSGLKERHYGVDISGPLGTPVRTTADGVVKLTGWHSGYGKLVVIEHDFGFSTRYAHNGRVMVKVGDVVKRGQAIALMGNTGKSSGPHCHYEVLHHKKRVNPYAYLNGEYPKLDSLSSKPSKKKTLES